MNCDADKSNQRSASLYTRVEKFDIVRGDSFW